MFVFMHTPFVFAYICINKNTEIIYFKRAIYSNLLYSYCP
mgnify:CR=1 FL=1